MEMGHLAQQCIQPTDPFKNIYKHNLIAAANNKKVNGNKFGKPMVKKSPKLYFLQAL